MRLPSEIDLATDLSCGGAPCARRCATSPGSASCGAGAAPARWCWISAAKGRRRSCPRTCCAGRFDRPLRVLARELLDMRTMLACQAVRLAARYAEPAALDEARRILARAASLEDDPAAHGSTSSSSSAAWCTRSGIWPAVWLANVFWAPMRELHATARGAVGGADADYQRQTARLLDLIEKRDAEGAVRHLGPGSMASMPSSRRFRARRSTPAAPPVGAALSASRPSPKPAPERRWRRESRCVVLLAARGPRWRRSSSARSSVATRGPRSRRDSSSAREQAIVAACADALFPPGGPIPVSGTEAGLVATWTPTCAPAAMHAAAGAPAVPLPRARALGLRAAPGALHPALSRAGRASRRSEPWRGAGSTSAGSRSSRCAP